MKTSQKDKQQQRYEATYAELLAVVNANRLGFELSLKACIAVAATIVNQEHEVTPLTPAEKFLLIKLAEVLLSAGAVPASISLDADLNARTHRHN